MSLTAWTLPTFAEFINKASSVVDDVKQSTSEFYQAGVIAYNEGKDAVESKVEEAKYALWELTTAQAEVDARINSMDEGPEKQALIAKRDQSRSFFSEHVAPLANDLMKDQEAYTGMLTNDALKYSNFAGHKPLSFGPPVLRIRSMGLIPAVPVAVGAGMVAVSAAIIYWAHEAYALENAILNDPTLQPGEKYKLALQAGQSGIMGSLVKLKLPIFALAVVGGIFFFLPKGKKA